MQKTEFDNIVKADAVNVANVMAANAGIFETATLKGKVMIQGATTHDFLVNRFKNVVNTLTSRKNILLVFAVFFLGFSNPYVAGGLIAVAMILNTVEKCFYLNNANAEIKLGTAEAAKAEAESFKELAAKIK